ncbi:tyrosine/phenylalanine carboxypeptidase domain-containing protein [Aerosakkonema sp. BLCC-F183]|uniref:tyrosine/phenylalanine carboxypeptidase domain-containing protein n=1 Tax=Aerosakkonema sp. BLCC-F183 TaxID=3342834 RepID=UPI0035B82F33
MYASIDVDHYTAPLNRDTEKQQLFTSHAAGEIYNPQFSYHSPPSGWEEPFSQFISELQPHQNIWENWIYKDVDFTLELMRAAATRDPVLATEATVKVYGEPSADLVQIAYEMLAKLPLDLEPRTIPSEDMAARMRKALTEAGLTDWCVIISNAMSARISVRSIDKQVKVNAEYLFSPSELKRLLVHEIGTHVFRAVNGDLQPLRLLRFGLCNYLLTEEGLANYHEASYGVQSPADQRRYALRVIAADMSLNHSFYEVFHELVQYTTLDEAFDIVARAKRGFIDTNVPGCHVKDKVYLEGFRQVSAYLERYPDDYSLLMCGKVALSMLPELRNLRENSLLVQPRYLPEHLVQTFV